MVAPVTGPFASTDYIYFPPPYGTMSRWFRQRSWYRQKKPFDLNLAYNKSEGWVQQVQGDVVRQSASGLVNTLNTAFPASVKAEAVSKSWSRFVDAIGENAQLGASLAEGRQALGMMVSRVTQLARFAKHLNRFEFEKARHDLELPKKKSTDVWSRDRTVANNFLEVHFGWSPLVSDIHDAMSVLTSPVKPAVVKGRGASDYVVTRDNYPPPAGSWSQGSEWKWRAKVQHLAHVEVSNPNIALANRLGFLNPASVAWELVPYSFVVDWFVNVGQVLSCWSDLFGYSVTNPMTTSYLTVDFKTTFAMTPVQAKMTGQAYSIGRVLSLTRPTPYVKPFKGFSVVRGLTAMALLVQKLPKRPADLATPPLRRRPIYRWTDYAAETGQVPYSRDFLPKGKLR